MAIELSLGPNESIVMRSDNISHGGRLAGFTDELVLTNQQIILISKKLSGKVKDIQYYPLAQIKVFNNQAQALVGRKQNGSPSLDVFFKNGQESFGFNSKRTTKQWAENIALLVGGQDVEIDNLGKHVSGQYGAVTDQFIDMVDQVREQFSDQFGDSFKTAFGIRPKDNQVRKPVNEMIATKCLACGAPLSGKKGQIKKCRYCETDNRL